MDDRQNHTLSRGTSPLPLIMEVPPPPPRTAPCPNRGKTRAWYQRCWNSLSFAICEILQVNTLHKLLLTRRLVYFAWSVANFIWLLHEFLPELYCLRLSLFFLGGGGAQFPGHSSPIMPMAQNPSVHGGGSPKISVQNYATAPPPNFCLIERICFFPLCIRII